MSHKQATTRIVIEKVYSSAIFFEKCIKFALQTDDEIIVEVTAPLIRKDYKALKNYYASGVSDRLLFRSHAFKLNKGNEDLIIETLRNYSILKWRVSPNNENVFVFDFDLQLFYIIVKEEEFLIFKEWLTTLVGQSIIREFKVCLGAGEMHPFLLEGLA